MNDQPVYPTVPTAAAAAPTVRRRHATIPDFEGLVGPHLPVMRSAAERVVRCPHAADDVVQSVLMRVWSKGWLPPEPREALCALTRLASLQHLRASRRRCEHERCAALPPEADCLYEDPLGVADRREQVGEVRRAVAGLLPGHRSVIELYVRFEDYRRVAAELQVPIGTVRSRLHRARRAVREALEGGSVPLC